MTVRKREPRFRLKSWPTEDWYFTHASYRFIKATFEKPVTWVSGLRVRGAHHVPSTGGVLLAANHLSWADPVVVGAAIHRPAFYLAKEAVFNTAMSRVFMEAMGQIKVDRNVGGNEGAIVTSVALLRQGLVVGVFPEGTRSRPGHIKRGKTGIARIAATAGAPVVPVGIDTSAFWPKDRTLPRFGEKVYVNIGAPMHFGLKPQDAEDRGKMREVTDAVMDRVRALYEEAVHARERGDPWR